MSDYEEHLCRLHVMKDRHDKCTYTKKISMHLNALMWALFSVALSHFHTFTDALTLEGLLIWLTDLITRVDGSSTPW